MTWVSSTLGAGAAAAIVATSITSILQGCRGCYGKCTVMEDVVRYVPKNLQKTPFAAPVVKHVGGVGQIAS
jgi:hypothetical protein